MKTIRQKHFILIGVAILALGLTGCIFGSDEDKNTDLASGQTIDLDAEFGGLNFSDEAPMFGDPELMNMDPALGEGEEGEDFEDAIALDPVVDVMERHPHVDIYALRAVWGNLGRPKDEEIAASFPAGTDWSGSLSVDRGAIVLRRLIRFEPEQGDHIVRPRTDRRLLEWQSTTFGHHDGLVVTVLDPMVAVTDTTPTDSLSLIQASSDSFTTPNTITFDTDVVSLTFEVSMLADLDTIISIDSSGLELALRAVKLPRGLPCPRGFLGGIWKSRPDEPGGVFYGRWMNELGTVGGYLRGHYGVNSSGQKVFFGKYIDRSGRFMGMLKGRYDNIPDRRGGWFSGVWIGKTRRVHGELGGRYVPAERGGRGYFQGRWRVDCR